VTSQTARQVYPPREGGITKEAFFSGQDKCESKLRSWFCLQQEKRFGNFAIKASGAVRDKRSFLASTVGATQTLNTFLTTSSKRFSPPPHVFRAKTNA
jgi:hypothetical protein